MPQITQEEFLDYFDNREGLPATNLFLTGGAGTGKTFITQHLLESLDQRDVRYVLTAPTGVAALNLGGVTLHSLFNIPFGLKNPRSQAAFNQVKLRKEKRELFELLQLLIIDEISRVRSDVLEYIDELLKRVRVSQEPFGGVQLLAIGDPFQLPPVVQKGEDLTAPWFFQAPAWLAAEPLTCELSRVYRQSDPTFINLLNEARQGNCTISSLQVLGHRIRPKPPSPKAIILGTINRSVDTINNGKLALLDKAKEFSHTATARLYPGGPSSETMAIRQTPAVDDLKLRPGARVTMLNNDPSGRWVNGSLGTFLGTIEKGQAKVLEVELDDNPGYPHYVEPVTWDITDYEAGGSAPGSPKGSSIWMRKILAQVTQYPVRLGWSVTVHKSQGLSLPLMHYQLDYVFAAGQSYVALSRATSLEGLTLSAAFRNKHLIVDRDVLAFMKTQR